VTFSRDFRPSSLLPATHRQRGPNPPGRAPWQFRLVASVLLVCPGQNYPHKAFLFQLGDCGSRDRDTSPLFFWNCTDHRGLVRLFRSRICSTYSDPESIVETSQPGGLLLFFGPPKFPVSSQGKFFCPLGVGSPRKQSPLDQGCDVQEDLLCILPEGRPSPLVNKPKPGAGGGCRAGVEREVGRVEGGVGGIRGVGWGWRVGGWVGFGGGGVGVRPRPGCKCQVSFLATPLFNPRFMSVSQGLFFEELLGGGM